MHTNSMTWLSESTADQGIPLNGMFELTERCNLHCRFCYVANRSQTQTNHLERTADEWLGMIRQAADAGMLICTFTGGEPFVREDFDEIYCKAYDMGLRIAIFTNAVLIGEKQRAFLRKRPPGLVSISLYGASGESYRELCGDAEDFHLAMESIQSLRADGIHMEIKALPLKPLMHEYRSLGQLAVMYHCPVKLDCYLGSCRNDPCVDIRQMRIPSDQINDALDAFDQGAQIPKPIKPQREANHADPCNNIPAIPCHAGKNLFCIAHDGRMYGCPTLTCFESSPFMTGFAAAWNELREQMGKASGCEECNHCPHFFHCPACPSIRAGETGSISKCNEYLRSLAFSLSVRSIDTCG